MGTVNGPSWDLQTEGRHNYNVLIRKEERGKQGQTNNKAKQPSTPKAVTFPKKNELPWVGLKPTTLYMYSIQSVLPLRSYQGYMYVLSILMLISAYPLSHTCISGAFKPATLHCVYVKEEPHVWDILSAMYIYTM